MIITITTFLSFMLCQIRIIILFSEAVFISQRSYNSLKYGFKNLDGCEFEIRKCFEDRNHADINIVKKTKILTLFNTNIKIAKL